MMWFSRKEFDRNSWFYTDTDVRGKLGWDSFCEMKLPVPSIEKQREVVKEYNVIADRIKLNEQLNQKLEETAQALYKYWFVDFEFPDKNGKPYRSSGGKMVYNEEFDKEIPEGWGAEPISGFGKVVTGKTPSSKNPEDFGDSMFFVTPGDFKYYNKFALSSERKLSNIGANKLKNKILVRGSVIVTCIGSDMGKIAVTYANCITNQQMNSIKVYKSFYTDYLYNHLSFISDEIKGIALGSSTMPMLNKTDFERIHILKPHEDILKSFEEHVSPINDSVVNYSKQVQTLTKLQSVLLSKISTARECKSRTN